MPFSSRGNMLPHQMLLKLAQPSLVYDRAQQRWASKLAAMTQQFVQQRFHRFVQTARHEQVCFSYCNDPTPVSLTTRYDFGGGAETLVRGGKQAVELFAQRVWAFTVSGASSVLVGPPRAMANKSASCHFNGLQALGDFPVLFGVTGLNISHGIWDRGIYTSEYRLF